MTGAEVERIRRAAIANGRRERREQGISERVEAEAMTATLASLLSERDEAYRRRSRVESGVPVFITDPVVLARAADILNGREP